MEWLDNCDNMGWAVDMALKINSKSKKMLFKAENLVQVIQLKKLSPDIQTPPLNYAKSKDKGLDFTHLPAIEAYNKYLDVQIK
jgi:hypothetical protein